MSQEPEWVSVEDARLYQREIVRVFGGVEGLRDAGLLESALDRARNVHAYENADLVHLAAVYAHALVRNHPFVDGNKRVAFVVARIFLAMNGVAFDPPEHEAVVMIEGLASADLPLDVFTDWMRKHSS